MDDVKGTTDSGWFSWWPEHVALLKRAIVGTFDYRGRSRRTEVAVLWIASMLILGVASGFTGLLPFPNDALVQLAVSLLLMLPFFAQFVRRLHDQDRTGWWALLLLLFTMLSIYQRLEFSLLTPPPDLAHRLPAIPGWVLGSGFATWLATMVFILAPGTQGPNRFGPDPRRSIHPEQLGAGHQQDDPESAQDRPLR